MANSSGNSKQLTASVRLNTQQFESRLKRIARGIDALNNAVGKQSRAYNAVNNALKNNERQVRKVKSQVEKVNTAVTKTSSTLNLIKSKVSSVSSGLKRWANNLKSTQSMFSGVWGFVRKIAGALIGLGTIKLAIQGADTLTGAENRLNNIAAKSLGDAAYTRDASGNVTGYSQAANDFTQSAMDKMYVAAKNSRGSYSDMMANVSKTMTLSPDAFQGNIDNAIRFQEIMSKAYTVGGASAQEMSNSMYQLTQALGSGVLQGDELRSVREGAPLAYQAIEKFAQGVLRTDESLKDLASDGKITSEMVVAAVMDMGEGIDQAFALTKWRFSEVWESIKSSAQRAFQPVVSMLTDALNQMIDNGFIERVEQFFTNIAKAAIIAFTLIQKGINWMADNWSWLQYIVYGAILVMIASLGVLAANAILTYVTFLMNNPFILWIMGIALLVAAFVWLIDKTGSTCNAIYQICFSLAWAIIGILAIVLVAYLATGMVMLSIPTLIALVIIGVLALLAAAFVQWGAEIVGTAYGVGAYISTVFDNFGIFFDNLLAELSGMWWNFVADLCEDIDWLLDAINAVAGFFGKETITIEEMRSKADEALGSKREYLDPMAAYNKAYAEGYAIGEGWQNKINAFGEKIKNLGNGEGDGNTSLLDEIANKLGLDLSGMGNFPTEGTNSSSYDPNELLKNIEGNTGKMADSMELSEEDLEYLRRVADMEWKKEFTTASIVVDMTNNNQINGDGDLDGIVTRLADKLYEEMNIVANGVYA